ncbi:MAG: VTT domain-containing protein [Candidatus Nomurabacteria bacterium]|jgi:uncharacterized membrane protein YdjX (TVP38/TMEM64 family)|nr:VTT domain-containing protein [Candidatus Nomurabacteria bacterium]
MPKFAKYLLLIAGTIIAALLVYTLVVDLYPLAHEMIVNHSNENKTVGYMESYGVKGVPILIALEALLAMLTVVPADPVHMLSGLCYGLVLGSLICVVGQAIGNSLIFILFRRFHHAMRSLVSKNNKSLPSANKLDKMRHPETIAFLAYLVPGIPNIIVPYLFAKTNIAFWRYLASVTLAQVPGIILCVVAGGSLANGNWGVAVAALVAILALAGAAFVFKGKISAKLNS